MNQNQAPSSCLLVQQHHHLPIALVVVDVVTSHKRKSALPLHHHLYAFPPLIRKLTISNKTTAPTSHNYTDALPITPISNLQGDDAKNVELPHTRSVDDSSSLRTHMIHNNIRTGGVTALIDLPIHTLPK